MNTYANIINKTCTGIKEVIDPWVILENKYPVTNEIRDLLYHELESKIWRNVNVRVRQQIRNEIRRRKTSTE